MSAGDTPTAVSGADPVAVPTITHDQPVSGPDVVVLDYGFGNVRSVVRALERGNLDPGTGSG